MFSCHDIGSPCNIDIECCTNTYCDSSLGLCVDTTQSPSKPTNNPITWRNSRTGRWVARFTHKSSISSSSSSWSSSSQNDNKYRFWQEILTVNDIQIRLFDCNDILTIWYIFNLIFIISGWNKSFCARIINILGHTKSEQTTF